MKKQLLLPTLLAVTIFLFSCTKKDDNPGCSLRILKSPTGQNQTITANIDDAGYVNFNAQTILADGGTPLHNYNWTLDAGTTPSGITIEPLTGVIRRISTSSDGLSAGTTTFNVTVSDGSCTQTEAIDLKVTSYTPGPLAVFQQLSSSFQLVNGDANKPYGASLFAMGGTPPYSWKLDNSYEGSVDLTNAGLTIEATGGIVRGTSLNSASGKTIKFRVIVTDNTGTNAVYSTVYSIKVN